GDDGGALRRPRRHLGREGGVLRQLDEDRPPGIPPDERTLARLRLLRLPDRRAAYHAGHQGRRGNACREAPPPHAPAQGLRHLENVVCPCFWLMLCCTGAAQPSLP